MTRDIFSHIKQTIHHTSCNETEDFILSVTQDNKLKAEHLAFKKEKKFIVLNQSQSELKQIKVMKQFSAFRYNIAYQSRHFCLQQIRNVETSHERI